MDKEQRAHEFALAFVKDRLRHTTETTYDSTAKDALPDECAKIYEKAFKAFQAVNH